MIGKTVSHYNILEKLGEGGMGVVYKAEDTKLKRTVALKFLPTNLTRDQTANERFQREAQAAAALNHPNIVTIYEINEHEDQTYIAMEYVEGQTLKGYVGTKHSGQALPENHLNASPLPVNKIIDITTQICEGLAKAHQADIIHRDIKPQNIIIDKDGRVKILDFGLVKLKGVSPLTKESTTLGTFHYMSPEQTQGAKLDHRSDIWSLGVVLYEMITGQLPFKGEYAQAVVYCIMNEEPEPLTSLRSGVPLELERIVNKTLTKDPGERYQHADDLIVDLRKLKKDSDSQMVSAKHKTPESKAKLEKRFMIPAIILLALLIVIGGYFIFKGKPEPVKPIAATGGRPSLAIVYFENKSGDESLDNWREAFSELLTTDLSQSKYLRVLRSDQVYSIFKRLDLLETKRYSTEDLQKVAEKCRVNRILKGSYIKAGDNFVITTMLIDADSGETLSSLSVEAKGEKDIFPKVDDLTKQIKLELDLSPDQVFADIDKNLGKVTTSSPEAYKHYIEGAKYNNNLKFRKAIRSLEKAIEIDPGFALAYRKLSRVYGNLGYDVLEAEYLKKAFELRHRVSERERLIIQGDFYWASEKTMSKALESFDRLLQIYPEDWLGNYLLAGIYREIEEWDKALEYYKVCIDNYETSIYPYSHSCEVYMAKGLNNKAREVLENSLDKVDNKVAVHRELALMYINLGKYDRALIEIGKSSSLDPSHYENILYRGDIYFCRGELEKAANEYKKLLQHEDERAAAWYLVYMACLDSMRGKVVSQKAFIDACLKKAKELNMRWADRALRFELAAIYRKTGNPGAALKEYDKVARSADEDGKLEDLRKALWNKGLTYSEMGAIEKARQTAVRLKALIENGVNPKKIRYYYHLQGQIASKTKDFSKAAAYFNKALSGMPQHWYFRLNVLHSMGNTYLQAGNMEKAQETFEKIISFNGWARIYQSDLVSRSYYKLGKIYQKLGLKDKAINSFKKFIDFWKDCDPQFQPLVDDARKWVKELESSN